VVLNGIHDIRISVPHLEDLFLFKEANKYILILSGNPAEHAGLIAFHPATVGANFCLAIISGSEQNRLHGLYIR
jgi:hypothetical protein